MGEAGYGYNTATESHRGHGQSENPVYGKQEWAAYNGHFECMCYHPLFCPSSSSGHRFNRFGDCEGAMLRPGNVPSAQDWRLVLEPIVALYVRSGGGKYFRGDAPTCRGRSALSALWALGLMGRTLETEGSMITWRRRASSMPSGSPCLLCPVAGS